MTSFAPFASLGDLDRATFVRAYCLFVPLALTAALWLYTRPTRREGAGIVLASAWQAHSLVGLHLLARRAGWWEYDAAGGLFLGFPVDLYIGWTLFWGALPVLVSLALTAPGRREQTGPTGPTGQAGQTGWQAKPRALDGLGMWPLVVGAVLLDALAMPFAVPVVRLGERWLLGEAVGVVLCLVPAQLLARWTVRGSHLAARATLQAICFSALFLGVLSAAILEMTGQSDAWEAVTARPAWIIGLLAQALAIPATLGLSAVQEFAVRGGGTPLPYDPPRRLVTSGPYAYVANPMQLSMALLFICWGVVLGSGWVVVAAVVSLAYSQGIAAWDEWNDLPPRFGALWRHYRRHVRAWWPRWRPYVPPEIVQTVVHSQVSNAGPSSVQPAQPVQPPHLYLAGICDPCSSVWAWFAARTPHGLVLTAAEKAPGGPDTTPITRLTYVGADGYTVSGVAALARGLEHLHLGWALAGWFLRLPGVCWFIQTLVDAAGGGPRWLAVSEAPPTALAPASVAPGALAHPANR